MTQETFKTVVLRAANGCYLTQSGEVDIKERMVASVIALGKNDSADNYKEISKEEADAILSEQKEINDQPND